MTDYKEYFKSKKITVMGLGLLGRQVGVVKFLAELGTDLVVTDLKPAEKLQKSLDELKGFENIEYTLGEHKLEDFQGRDMIIKAAGVPLDSPYIVEARKNNIPIEMDVSLFSKLSPEVEVVGVTGTRGKSMTTMLIYEILSKNLKDRSVHLGGNIKGIATLPLLEKVKEGDVLVAELDSWQLQGFGESKISPHVAVFTSFLKDHMNYYGGDEKKYFADKANIFKYQTKDDYLVVRPDVKDLIPGDIKSQYAVINLEDVKGYSFSVPGEFQRKNLACAVEVAKIYGIPPEAIKKTIAEFKGMEGRLQFVREVSGVKIYNDNNATTPEATIAGIQALQPHRGTLWGKEKGLILIAGGTDKGLLVDELVKAMNECKKVILIPGSGTDRLPGEFERVGSIELALELALEQSKPGDIILFSPGFASFDQFNNEYERGDLFMKLVKKLK